jgi:cytochrome c-type biogenesis protein CcmF
LHLGTLSVGPQYFNPTFLLPILPLLALVSVGMHSGWKRGNLARVRRPILGTLVLAVALALALCAGAYDFSVMLLPVGLALGLWIALAALVDPVDRLRRGLSLPAGIVGMSLAHIGLGVLTIGITVVQSVTVERDTALAQGAQTTLGSYSFRFEGTAPAEGANFSATEATVTVNQNGREVAVLKPQKRNYWVQQSAMTEAAISSSWNRDLFVAMGEDLGQGKWSLRLQVRPLIQFVWFGAIIMMVGGVVSGLDRRYKLPKTAPVAAAETATAGAQGQAA